MNADSASPPSPSALLRFMDISRLCNIINSGFPEKSYLLQKIEQEKLLIGGQMPLGGPPLSREQIEIIRQWISSGAPPPP
jgi:hypothetical protein